MFFAGAADYRDLVQFMYRDLGLVAYESYSEIDKPLRRFETDSELEASFPYNTFDALLKFWSPSICPEPRPTRLEMTDPVGSVRYRIGHLGMIQLHAPPAGEDALVAAHVGNWEERGARSSFEVAAADVVWRELRKVSGQIQRRIKRRAVARAETCWVLREAKSLLDRGVVLRVYARTVAETGADLRQEPSNNKLQRTRGAASGSADG